MKIKLFLFISILFLFCGCKKNSRLEGAWWKIEDSSILYIYTIDDIIGFDVEDSNDNYVTRGLLVFANDSVCDVYDYNRKNMGKAVFHSKGFYVDDDDCMIIEGCLGNGLISKYVVDEKKEKAIKAILSIVIPEIAKDVNEARAK